MVGIDESAHNFCESSRVRQHADVPGSFEPGILCARNQLPVSPRDFRRNDLVQMIVPAEITRRYRELIPGAQNARLEDRKSTRLNSSHLVISYAVFCL